LRWLLSLHLSLRLLLRLRLLPPLHLHLLRLLLRRG
jgi:hypothetical protein